MKAPICSRIYRDGVLVASDVDAERLHAEIGDPGTLVWAGLLDPTKEELDRFAGALGLHELAIEDAISPHQRSKLDHYPDHLFLSCHSARLDVDEGELVISEIDAFIGDGWLITVHHGDGEVNLDPLLARWDRLQRLAGLGVSFLLYGLLDLVIDDYFEIVEAFDEFFDQISEDIFSEKAIPPDRQLHWFQMRRALVRFHRLAVPMRETVSALMRRDQTTIPNELYPYFQDVYDHILRVSESTDSLRDLVATIVETNLSLRDFRQNQVMKKVTSWAAIIAVPTLITGFYGMNVRYPGFATYWGAWFSTGLMALISFTLYQQFKRREWL